MDKTRLAGLLVRANAFAPFRYFNRTKLPVLMYHRFSESEEFGKTSRRNLRQHLVYLTKHYKVVSLTEAVSSLVQGRSLPVRSAVITIDDGYSDFYETAFPVLKEFSVPATLYVVTDFVGGKCWIWTDVARFILLEAKVGEVRLQIDGKLIEKSLDGVESRLRAAGSINSELKKLPVAEKDGVLIDLAKSMKVEVPAVPPATFAPLRWDQAREMAGSGIEIGSHTVSHPILTNVDAPRLDTELRNSRSEIENELQRENIHFCYPNGNVSERERNAVEKAGYASAVTTQISLCENGADKFLIPRIDAEPQLQRFVQATSGFDSFKSRVR